MGEWVCEFWELCFINAFSWLMLRYLDEDTNSNLLKFAILFLEIIISSCISLNVVLAVFSQLSFQFHVNLSEWHSLPVSRCNLRCELIFKAFWVLFVDWYTFQFQFFLLRLFKDIVILNYCLNVIFEDESSLLSLFFILYLSFFWGSSHQVNLIFLSQDYKCFVRILCWLFCSFETEILVIWHE